MLFIQTPPLLTTSNLRRKTCEAYKAISLLLTNFFFHTQESHIKAMTTCLNKTNSLPLSMYTILSLVHLFLLYYSSYLCFYLLIK